MHLRKFLRSLIENTLQLKPYFTIVHKILVRDEGLDPENSKEKVTFEKVYKALDSSEFYEKIPKVNPCADPHHFLIVFQLARVRFQRETGKSNDDHLAQ